MHRPGLAWPHSSAIFWFSTGVLWKSGKPSGFHDVKRSDYITNSVRCQGTVIFLNKMKGESGRLEPVEKLAQPSFFLCQISSIIGLNIKPLNFMKFKITDTEPFDVSALGVFTVTGRNMEERELKLWDMVETIVDDKLKSLTYKRLRKVTI